MAADDNSELESLDPSAVQKPTEHFMNKIYDKRPDPVKYIQNIVFWKTSQVTLCGVVDRECQMLYTV